MDIRLLFYEIIRVHIRKIIKYGYILFSLTSFIFFLIQFLLTLNTINLFWIFIMNFPFRAIIIWILIKIKFRK